MILNTGGRTDIVQYYTDWLLKRFEEGYVLVRNPLFSNRVTKYDLTPDKVDCIVFCSKNYEPILPYIKDITDKFNTYFQYTITAYGKDIEPKVPSIEESMHTLKKLSAIVGKQRTVWRYDPILLTQKYTIQTHLDTFNRMAKELAPHVSHCFFNFVEMHKHIETNMPEILPLTMEDKETLAKELAKIATKNHLTVYTCAQNGVYTKYGIQSSGCLTLDILGNANEIVFRNLKHKGLRKGCLNIENRDIGAYDTCINGCKYCYANKNPKKIQENFKSHSPYSPLLSGDLIDTDNVQQGAQKSFMAKI